MPFFKQGQKGKASPKAATNPSGGVTYYQQFLKNFLRPYGRAECAPDQATIMRRIKPYSCELLKRPKIGMSEMAETITENIDVLSSTQCELLDPLAIASFTAKLQPLLNDLGALNSKGNNTNTATSSNVKHVLKFFVKEDNGLDSLIDEAYEAGQALFSMATYMIVARTLFRNPELYSRYIACNHGEDTEFQRYASMKSLLDLMVAACVQSEGKSNSKLVTPPTRSHLLEDLESSTDEDSDQKIDDTAASTENQCLVSSENEQEIEQERTKSGPNTSKNIKRKSAEAEHDVGKTDCIKNKRVKRSTNKTAGEKEDRDIIAQQEEKVNENKRKTNPKKSEHELVSGEETKKKKKNKRTEKQAPIQPKAAETTTKENKKKKHLVS